MMITKLYGKLRSRISNAVMSLSESIILRVPACTCGDASASGMCRKHPGSYRLVCLEAEHQAMIEKINEIEERIKELKR